MLKAVAGRSAVDVVVLGGGAAGLMCAAEAGGRGRRVLVLEAADRVGKKILISGGGRCNFTNLGCRAENFLSENPHFARSALAGFTPELMVALVERHRIAYHEKTLGQLFCDGSSREIVQMLERECLDGKVEIRTGTRITEVVAQADGFEVRTEAGAVRTRSVVVATGGLSIPKMGASGIGYELAGRFGLRVVPCRPGLVPFTFGPDDRERWCGLAGSSAEVEVRRGGQQFREKLLVTHRGVSGPAVLQISSYWHEGEPVEVDLAPGRAVFTGMGGRGRRDALAAAREVLPSRWAEQWVSQHVPDDRVLGNKALLAMERAVHGWTLRPDGTEGFSKAEVTVGGVATSELHAATLEAKAVPGLFFIGEVVDVTGWLGGYNFQWAWASGVAAGRQV